MRSLLLPLLFACSNGKTPATDSAPAADSGGTGGGEGGEGGADGGGDGGGDEGGEGGADGGGDDGGSGGDDTAAEQGGDVPAVRLTGAVTWALEFDAEAEANGFTDCTYTRSFDGTQTLQYDFLCPECEVLTRGTATMSDGYDCYVSVFGEDNAGDRTEMWGIGGGGTKFYRATVDQLALGELADITAVEGEDVAVAWTSDGTLTDGGTMTLNATGSFRYETDPDTLIVDPWTLDYGPYTCGWPDADPGDLVLDYVPVEGGTFPNVFLEDQCGETVSLWDFYGSWLVLTTSQPDCGPCRSMASESEAFVDAMALAGYDVKVIDLLGAGLSYPYLTPDEDTFNEWVDRYSLTEPVLYDKGFGYAMFPEFAETYSGEDFGYPTWLIVDPTMTLRYANVGFSSWDAVGTVIEDLDAE